MNSDLRTPRTRQRPGTGAAPPRWWQWPTVLSLDAPAVVLAWQWLFAAHTGAPLGRPEVFVLATTVWLAYAADRWFEAFLLPPTQIRTTRHRFYHDHCAPIALIWIAVLLTDMAVAFVELPARALIAGGCLGVPAIVYVLSHQLLHRGSRWRVPKEICVAILIAAASCVFVAAVPGAPRGALAAPVALFAALCLANLLLISAWEADVDETHGQDSLARQFGAVAAFSHLVPLLLTAAALAAPFWGVWPVVAHSVAASALLLALVDRYEPQLGSPLARVLADVVLLTPLIPLLHGLR